MRASGIVALVGIVAMGGCVPWTVRPIRDDERSGGQTQASNPSAYVDSIWSSKLAPAVENSATDARTLLDAMAASLDGAGQRYGHREGSGTWYFAIKGHGKVRSIDTRSRNGLLEVDIPPLDGRADVSIQIGPVLRGSSLRDATGIIRFTDFVNQLQFADVANELNNRVLATVLKSLDVKTLRDRTITFAGAFSLAGSGEPAIRDVVPVRLAVEEERP